MSMPPRRSDRPTQAKTRALGHPPGDLIRGLDQVDLDLLHLILAHRDPVPGQFLDDPARPEMQPESSQCSPDRSPSIRTLPMGHHSPSFIIAITISPPSGRY